MANVDIVYDWFGGRNRDLHFGIDSEGGGYIREGDIWRQTSLVNDPCVRPALAALARIAETIGSVTWRADNRMDEEQPQSPAPEAGGEEPKQAIVGEALPGDPGV